MTGYGALSELLDIAQAVEGYEITMYNIIRPMRDGGQRELVVRVLDGGRSAGQLRYMVDVEDVNDPQLRSLGNPSADLRDAMHNPHWQEFD